MRSPLSLKNSLASLIISEISFELNEFTTSMIDCEVVSSAFLDRYCIKPFRSSLWSLFCKSSIALAKDMGALWPEYSCNMLPVLGSLSTGMSSIYPVLTTVLLRGSVTVRYCDPN